MNAAILIIGILTLLAAGATLVYTVRSDRRDTERSDVVWVADIHRDGNICIRHDGRDEVKDLEVSIEVSNAPPIITTCAALKAGGSVKVHSKALLDEVKAEEDRVASATLANSHTQFPTPVIAMWIDVGIRASWKSQRGRAANKSWTERFYPVDE